MAAPNADKLLDDLSAYLDGELDADRVHEINALLERSPEARQQLDELRQIAVEVRAMPRAEAPDDLPAAILRGSNIGQRRNAFGVGRELYPRLGQYTGMAAAAVLFFGLGTLIAPYLPRMTRVDPATGQLPLVTTIVDASAAPVDTARVAEPGAVARAEIDERKLRSLGYISDAGDDEAPAISAEESLALARRAASGPAGRHAAGDVDTPALRVVDASAADAAPFVNIVIEPRTAEEFENVRREVDTWNSIARNDAARALPVEPASGEAGGAATQSVLTANVRPGRANRLISNLQQQVPDRVEVSMSFNSAQVPAVQRLLQPESGSAQAQLGAPVVARENTMGAPSADYSNESAVEKKSEAARDVAATPLAGRGDGGGRGRSARDDKAPGTQPNRFTYMHRSTAPTSSAPGAGRVATAAAVPGAAEPVSGGAPASVAKPGSSGTLVTPDSDALGDATPRGYMSLRNAAVAVLGTVDRAIQGALGVEASPSPNSGSVADVDAPDPNFPHAAVRLQLMVRPPPAMSAPATSGASGG